MTISPNEYKNRIPEMKDVPWKEDPSQKIKQYPDGTIERIVTIDGHETRQRFHASGAYEEWRADGTVVSHAANNLMSYVKGGMTLTIDNTGDIKIGGHARISCGSDAHIEVAKNASVVVNGMAEVVSKGHIKLSAADISLQTTQGSIVFNSARDIELRAASGRITGHSGKVTTFTTDGGDFHVDAAGEVDLTSAGDTNINSSGKISTQSSGDTTIQSSADITSAAGGTNTTKVKDTGMRVKDGTIVMSKITYVGQDDMDQKTGAALPKFHSP